MKGGQSRKGLKRLGMRRYLVAGPKGVWIIERERPWRFVVRPEDWPIDHGGAFFPMPNFPRLFLARHHAETQAGLAPCPLPSLPAPLRKPTPPPPSKPMTPPEPAGGRWTGSPRPPLLRGLGRK